MKEQLIKVIVGAKFQCSVRRHLQHLHDICKSCCSGYNSTYVREKEEGRQEGRKRIYIILVLVLICLSAALVGPLVCSSLGDPHISPYPGGRNDIFSPGSQQPGTYTLSKTGVQGKNKKGGEDEEKAKLFSVMIY